MLPLPFAGPRSLGLPRSIELDGAGNVSCSCEVDRKQKLAAVGDGLAWIQVRPDLVNGRPIIEATENPTDYRSTCMLAILCGSQQAVAPQ